MRTGWRRLALAALLIAGCGKDHGTNPIVPVHEPEDVAIRRVIHSDPEWAGGELTPLGRVWLSDTTLLAVSAAIQPLAFTRTLYQTDTSYTWTYSDSVDGRPRRARVLVCKYEKGWLDILTAVAPPDSAPGDTVVRKVVRDDWFRYFDFRRVVDADSIAVGGEWRMIGLSAVALFSDWTGTKILTLRLRGDGPSGPVDTTYTDPFVVRDLTELPRLTPGTQASITVTTQHADDVVTLYLPSAKRILRDLGGATWQTDFTVGPGGFRHLMVNAQTHDTLFDDTYSNSKSSRVSDTWVITYRSVAP